MLLSDEVVNGGSLRTLCFPVDALWSGSVKG